MAGEERVLGRWKLVREIGRGGMGQVWLANRLEHLPPDGFPDQAAIKILPATLTQEPGISLRFQREMDILSKLSHPGIVTFLEAAHSQDHLGFAMEFVDGGSLQELLQSRGAFPWEEAVALAIQICQPMKHAHDRGVVHRDLKPSNILVKGWPDCPQVKLTDFGVASLFASSKLTATGGLVGTAETISPEQVAGKPATKRSDLYSLGVVLYTLITGQFPFRGHLAEVLHKQRFGQHERLGRLVDGLPTDLEKLVDELLSKDPGSRPPDAGLVARRLQVIARKDQMVRDRELMVRDNTTGPKGQVLPHPGEGPATFVSRVVRAHLEEQNRGGLWSRMMRNPWVVVPALAGVCAALVWVFWPEDERAKMEQGIRLMASTDPLERRRGWEEFLEPLSKMKNGPAPEDGFGPYAMKYEESKKELINSGRARVADVQSDGEWAYLCAKRLSIENNPEGSMRILYALIIAYRENTRESPWVRKAEAELGDNLARIGQSYPLADQESAKSFLKIATSLGAIK